MRTRKKVRNIESYYVREARNTRVRQDATIVMCVLITFGVIIWTAIK
jgi:hypothetical protein